MACVFGDMRTLKTSERWAVGAQNLSRLGKKERNACTAMALRSAFRGRAGMKSLPRYAWCHAQDSENAPKPLLAGASPGRHALYSASQEAATILLLALLLCC